MEEQELHHLLQLKSCTPPSPKAVEDFILEFQRRQRLASLNPSMWDLWKERLFFFLSEFQVPKIAYVVATLIALISSAFLILSPTPSPSTGSGSGVATYPVVAKSFSIYHNSSMLVPQNSIIPVSFQEETDSDPFFSPENISPRRKLDLRNSLPTF